MQRGNIKSRNSSHNWRQILVVVGQGEVFGFLLFCLFPGAMVSDPVGSTPLDPLPLRGPFMPVLQSWSCRDSFYRKPKWSLHRWQCSDATFGPYGLPRTDFCLLCAIPWDSGWIETQFLSQKKHPNAAAVGVKPDGNGHPAHFTNVHLHIQNSPQLWPPAHWVIGHFSLV